MNVCKPRASGSSADSRELEPMAPPLHTNTFKTNSNIMKTRSFRHLFLQCHDFVACGEVEGTRQVLSGSQRLMCNAIQQNECVPVVKEVPHEPGSDGHVRGCGEHGLTTKRPSGKTPTHERWPCGEGFPQMCCCMCEPLVSQVAGDAKGRTWVEVPPAQAGRRYYVNCLTHVRVETRSTWCICWLQRVGRCRKRDGPCLLMRSSFHLLRRPPRRSVPRRDDPWCTLQVPCGKAGRTRRTGKGNTGKRGVRKLMHAGTHARTLMHAHTHTHT